MTPTLTLDDYQTAAVGTAIYPGQGELLGLTYVALKMNGEAGEFAEHLGKAIRDDHLGSVHYYEHGDDMVEPLTAERRTKLIKELGDVAWYVAAAAKELGSSLSEVCQVNLDKLAARKVAGTLGGSGDDR